MKNWRRWHPEVILLTLAALATRLWNVTTPKAVVFDEVYFKTYAGDYLTHSYYFDPHPPLGKELLGAWAWLTHQSGAILATDNLPGAELRYLPALAGALIIPVVYILLRQVGGSRKVATLAALAVLTDNALIVESRFVLIDSMLILFGLSAVTAYLAARKRHGWRYWAWVVLAAVLSGLAVSVKWTGLTALGLVGLIWLYDTAKRKPLAKQIGTVIILLVSPLIVYMSVFAVHFAVLTQSGQGDAFMSTKFQSTLVGNANYDPSVKISFIDKFIDLNVAMKTSEDGLKTATHPYGSKWYTWPLELRSVYYWAGDTAANGKQGNIYLLGNPIVWWGTIVVLAILAGFVLADRRPLKRWGFAAGLLGIGYLVNWLPFSLIVRVMFLYHYFFALIYSIALAVLGMGIVAGWNNHHDRFWQFPTKLSRNSYIAAITLVILGFIYFAPLTYGTPMSPADLKAHDWLSSWR